MRLALLVLLATVTPAIGPSCGKGTDDGDGERSTSASPVQSTGCAEERQALVKAISDHKHCAKDSDCQALVSFCLHEGRVDCTGTFYVNSKLSSEAFGKLDGALSRCAGGKLPECATCAKEAVLPACIDGICSIPVASR